MCGFAGIISTPHSSDPRELDALAARMGHAIAHRGPDGHGTWTDAAGSFAVSHRRLSIQDPTVAGHQPMLTRDARHVLAFNGEIYNFREIARTLEAGGVRFDGHSDTEVLAMAIERWGFRAALDRIDGMFAIAAWDRHQRRLWLARDRVGKKPLYYGWAGNHFVFGSELKALWQHPHFSNGVDPDALAQLLHLGYIPAPSCIHADACKLRAAHWLCIDADRLPHRDPDTLRGLQQHYWSAPDAMRSALADRFEGNDAEARDAFGSHLETSVRRRLVADVPVGAFLSGGIDSSLIAVMMQRCSARPMPTFTIGFDSGRHDEAHWARAVAEHLGTDHTALHMSGSDAAALVPRLGAIYDEPFADPSQIPTWLACRLARSGVSVALSGDGGDETMLGYPRYLRARRAWQFLQHVPDAVRRLAAHLPTREHWQGERFANALSSLACGDACAIHARRMVRWHHPERVVLGAARAIATCAPHLASSQADPAETMMLADFMTYLPDDLLCKVDRASMSLGLEVRNPFLDLDLVRFAWSLPLAFKHREGQTKWLMRSLLRQHLPTHLVDRPKQGFSPPLARWLTHELRDWCADLLAPNALREDGHFDAGAIAELHAAVRAGRRRTQSRLWCVLMFQSWLAQWRASRREAMRMTTHECLSGTNGRDHDVDAGIMRVA